MKTPFVHAIAYYRQQNQKSDNTIWNRSNYKLSLFRSSTTKYMEWQKAMFPKYAPN